jgi:hypothetical protein
MDTHASLLVYKELADLYEQQGEASMRDRFLVLAADAAQAAGMPEEAERLRQQLLQVSPHHMLRPYSSFAQALQAPDVQIYIRDLRLNYPLDSAESLLRTLRDQADMPPPKEAASEAEDARAASRPAYAVRDEPAAQPARQTARSAAAPRTAGRSPIPLPAGAASAAAARPAKPAADAPAAKPVTRPAAQPREAPAPALRAPAAPRPSRPRPAADEAPSGSWLSSLLFGIVFLVGIALAAYALGRPFIPEQWLR